MHADDEPRPEYRRTDLGTGVRGKHFAEFWAGQPVAVLEPDVRAAFPTDEAVNAALRALIAKPAA